MAGRLCCCELDGELAVPSIGALEGGGRGPTPEPGEGRFPSRSSFLTPPLVFIEAKQVRESSLPRGPPLRTAAQKPTAKHPTPTSG